MRRLITITAAVLLGSPLAAIAEPIYLRCDFKDYKGTTPSGGAVDIILDESNRTVTSKIWDFPIMAGDIDRNPYFGPSTIEYAAAGGQVQMVLNRETGWLVKRGKNNVRVCIQLKIPKDRKF